jgi:hypothetical protein
LKNLLTKFAADLRVAMGFSASVLEISKTGFYLQINESTQIGSIQEIGLWHGLGDQQTPVINLSYRLGKDEFLAVTAVEKPIQPMYDLLKQVFKSNKRATVTRDQALIVIYTMMVYLKMRS